MDKHATAKHTDDKHHVLGKHTAFKHKIYDAVISYIDNQGVYRMLLKDVCQKILSTSSFNMQSSMPFMDIRICHLLNMSTEQIVSGISV